MMRYQPMPSSRPPPFFELHVTRGLARLALRFPHAMPAPRWRVRMRYYIESMLLAESLLPNTTSLTMLLERYIQFARATALGQPAVITKHCTQSLMFDAFSVQSEMNIDDPDQLILGYTQTMMGALLLQPAPRHIGMIGLGGGSLVKFCHRHLPEAAISVAEIDPDVIALRDRFQIPGDSARLAVHCVDGAQFVGLADGLFDLLMVDGFDRGGQPAALCSQAFYADCHRALAPGGVMVVNLLGDNVEETQAYIERMRASFGAGVLAVDALDSQNRIVFACKDGLPALDDATLRRRIDSLDVLHPVVLGAIAQRLQLTRQIQAGGGRAGPPPARLIFVD